jgi:hypothetical protein
MKLFALLLGAVLASTARSFAATQRCPSRVVPIVGIGLQQCIWRLRRTPRPRTRAAQNVVDALHDFL